MAAYSSCRAAYSSCRAGHGSKCKKECQPKRLKDVVSSIAPVASTCGSPYHNQARKESKACPGCWLECGHHATKHTTRDDVIKCLKKMGCAWCHKDGHHITRCEELPKACPNCLKRSGVTIYHHESTLCEWAINNLPQLIVPSSATAKASAEAQVKSARASAAKLTNPGSLSSLDDLLVQALKQSLVEKKQINDEIDKGNNRLTFITQKLEAHRKQLEEGEKQLQMCLEQLEKLTSARSDTEEKIKGLELLVKKT